jgi:hypothetical protein
MKNKTLTEKQALKISMTLRMFKLLLPLYIEVKNQKEEYNYFCGSLRSQIYDISFFKTGLISEAAKVKSVKNVHEHLYNRTLACKIIFQELENNPDMDVEVFVNLLIKYCSTIVITKVEHDRMTNKTKGMYKKTINDYTDFGIVVDGLVEYISSLEY